MIELHYFPGNASMAPHILLHELGLPFTLQRVDRDNNAHRQPAYLALNPNGQIPVLCDGDLVLYEAAAICLHLADKPSASPLQPADKPSASTVLPADKPPASDLMPPLGTPERAQAYKWLVWMTNTLQATLMHYFYPERIVDEGAAACAAQVRAHAQAKVGTLLDQIEAQLAGHGQAWLLGDRYGVCDAYGFMLCRWTRGFEGGASPPARTRPAIGAWLQRVQARPAVQRAMAAEGLAPPWV